MGLAMYLQTCGRIVSNPGVSTVPALVRHTLWHAVRRLHRLPLRVNLTGRSHLELVRREEINGCVALAWSQRLYDYHNMSFLLHVTQHPEFCRVCFDIGSNVGPYALVLSESGQAQVHAFEPHPGTFQTLKRCLELNGRHQVSAHHLALSDSEGQVRFSDSDCNPTNRVLAAGESGEPFVEVPATTGAKFCAAHGVMPDVLKIDTEGHEAEVLRGFGAVLESVKVVILEENVPQAQIRDYLPEALFEGPLYVDYPARRLRRTKFAYEDALYVRKAVIPDLQQLGYSIESATVL